MDYFDKIIETTLSALNEEKGRSISSDPARMWNTASGHTLILERECGLELGRDPKTSVEFTACTESGLINRDEIRIVGSDLAELQGREACFGKIVLLRVSGMEEERLYDQIKELEHIKFKLYLEGYMTRASVEKHCENIRISRKAISDGISLEKIGNTIISRYKAHPLVQNVQVIFITKEIHGGFKLLRRQAGEIRKITDAMCTILDDLNFDCASCQIKPVCDQVGGLMELHKKQVG